MNQIQNPDFAEFALTAFMERGGAELLRDGRLNIVKNSGIAGGTPKERQEGKRPFLILRP